MLTLEDTIHEGIRLKRRSFLRVGTLGMGGFSLRQLLALKSLAGASKSVLKDRSVIFLFQHGGPSQFETFDPKMDAPAGIRSATGEIPTTIPGITFGSTYERLARLAHKVAIVRSFVPGDADHNIKPIVSRGTLGANMGSLYARVAGATRIESGMPSSMALFPRAVSPDAGPAITDFGNIASSGDLGAAYAPFVPGSGSTLQQDMQMHLPQARIQDRRALLHALDQWRRNVETQRFGESLDSLQQQAFGAILRGVSNAFDLSRESPALIERYDTAPLIPRDRISKKWNNHPHYADHVNSLGKLLLLARRLCEQGAGFVTVTTSFVWDMHADVNNATMTEGMGYVGVPFDHAVSALIEDIEARGLRDKILVVCCGEMGRAPRINAAGGRDHWGNLGPLMLYGGGLKMGQVVGSSSRDGGEPSSRPITPQDLMATIMHTLMDLGEVRLMDGLPRELVEVLGKGEPIRELI